MEISEKNIDMMIGYPEFPNDVLNEFRLIIEEYDFEFSKGENGYIILGSKFCNLEIYTEHDTLEVFFSRPSSKIQRQYDADSVYTVTHNMSKLYWNDTPKSYQDGKDYIHKRLIKRLITIRNEFSFVLQGDFSWESNYHMYVNERKELGKKIMELDHNHPIKRKFWEQDPDWEAEAKSFFKYPPAGASILPNHAP